MEVHWCGSPKNCLKLKPSPGTCCLSGQLHNLTVCSSCQWPVGCVSSNIASSWLLTGSNVELQDPKVWACGRLYELMVLSECALSWYSVRNSMARATILCHLDKIVAFLNHSAGVSTVCCSSGTGASRDAMVPNAREASWNFSTSITCWWQPGCLKSANDDELKSLREIEGPWQIVFLMSEPSKIWPSRFRCWLTPAWQRKTPYWWG